MATVCAAFASSQAGRSAGARHLPLLLLSRRTLSSTASRRYATDSDGNKPEPGLRDALASSSKNPPPRVTRGSLGTASIFSDDDPELDLPTTDGPVPKHRRRQAARGEEVREVELQPLEERDLTNLDRTLDPRPNARIRWERKMVIKSIKDRGQLTKKERIMRTERESLTRSHWFKTSLKKLTPLARQIAGKSIDDAILQMRFSKKRAAKDVMALLKQARNQAVVASGMGLAKVEAMREQEQQQQQLPLQEDVENENDSEKGEKEKEEDIDKKLITPTWRTPRHIPGFTPVEIRTKDGTPLRVTDPSSIYIDQAWVNRGPYGTDFSHRARGNIHRLRPPWTGLSVILKEEKTRIREYQDRVEKEAKQRRENVWVQLPDRKIYQQNPYYSW